MKASDYLAVFLKEKGLTHVFGVQGGAAVHLFDSCHQCGPLPVYCHGEQAAGLAAVSYAKIKGYGACIVTTGPAGTNALTALLAAWQDSTPCLFVSGQARAAHTSYGTALRQVGSQEFGIVDVAAKISKAALFVKDAFSLRTALDYGYLMSLEGRPGPVWLDIPVDVQWTEC